MTPYEKHRESCQPADHYWYVPASNGLNIVEECGQCRKAWTLPSRANKDTERPWLTYYLGDDNKRLPLGPSS